MLNGELSGAIDSEMEKIFACIKQSKSYGMLQCGMLVRSFDCND